MSFVSVVCCQVEVSATGWSLVRRSPTPTVVRRCVWSRILVNEEVMTVLGHGVTKRKKKEKRKKKSWGFNVISDIWCDFDRASSLICGNKMPTRCNRGFCCRSCCLLNMFRGTTMPIIRSSRVLYSGCCLWYFVLWFFKLLVWRGAEGYVSGLQDAAASCKPDT